MEASPDFPGLIVGNDTSDDAAVFDMGNGESIISTTDFFMPIVDDPYDFGRIAAANSISDVYAMGGKPMMAIAILGWPINKLGPEVARKVIEGGRAACLEAGIPLAGGHSIDAPEPIFGLAVTGRVPTEKVKRNNSVKKGDKLYLTKPLGIGILTTAEKKGKLQAEHAHVARDAMCQLNKIGADLGEMSGVQAVTDVTGFGLMGHLLEMIRDSGLQAELDFDSLPLVEGAEHYRQLGCVPGGTHRNFESFGHQVADLTEQQKQILCDPQTSGGLLVSVSEDACADVEALGQKYGLELKQIGDIADRTAEEILVVLK